MIVITINPRPTPLLLPCCMHAPRVPAARTCHTCSLRARATRAHYAHMPHVLTARACHTCLLRVPSMQHHAPARESRGSSLPGCCRLLWNRSLFLITPGFTKTTLQKDAALPSDDVMTLVGLCCLARILHVHLSRCCWLLAQTGANAHRLVCSLTDRCTPLSCLLCLSLAESNLARQRCRSFPAIRVERRRTPRLPFDA